MIPTARTPAAMSRLSAAWRGKGLRVGLVPTMGALHEGHASLIRRARRECDRVVVSLFVNPLQFGPKEDFSRYPRAFAADRRLCAAAGADALYHPSAPAMYPIGFRTSVEVAGLSDVLCGAFRPGHFKGVATVVLKLLETVRPQRSYFGEKDYQQLVILKTMARDLGLPGAIVGCPLIREKDGLALSSRNIYLSPEERTNALHLSTGLRLAVENIKKGGTPKRAEALARQEISKIPKVKIDYVSVVDAKTLIPARRPEGRASALRILAAIKVGNTRLIDNLPVSCYTPNRDT